MSENDLDRIRRAYEVWNESGPEAVTERFWAEDAVYRLRDGLIVEADCYLDRDQALKAVGIAE